MTATLRIDVDRYSPVPLYHQIAQSIETSITDGTLFVVDAGRTRRGAVRSGREALAKADARTLGVALNRLPEHSSGGYYYYDYYGGYGAEAEGREGTQPRTASAPLTAGRLPRKPSSAPANNPPAPAAVALRNPRLVAWYIAPSLAK